MSPRAAGVVPVLRARAEMMARMRAFFAERGVLEVDTSILGDGLVVEATLDPIPCRVEPGAELRHLLTSPEGPMKRLLAAGSGPIYQLAHAFRDGERGRRHATEFALLEWYRPGLDHHQLMDEVEALVRVLLPGLDARPFVRRSYREVFVHGAAIDPFDTSLPELRSACELAGVPVPASFDSGSVDDALDLLLVGGLEPGLGRARPLFVHSYPPSQAALAQVATDPETGCAVAQRFELYIDGLELCNGYHELADPIEQRRRFEEANRDRVQSGRSALPIDEALIEALAGGGFPACAGVALGFDRLLMLACGVEDIAGLRPETG